VVYLRTIDPAIKNYSGVDSAIYRKHEEKRHFSQENAASHEFKMTTLESKPLESSGAPSIPRAWRNRWEAITLFNCRINKIGRARAETEAPRMLRCESA
jgi:hypothetical protein